MVQINVVQHYISGKKVGGCICLSPTGVELGAWKIATSQNIISYWNRKVDSVSGWTLKKLPVI